MNFNSSPINFCVTLIQRQSALSLVHQRYALEGHAVSARIYLILESNYHYLKINAERTPPPCQDNTKGNRLMR